VVPALFGPAERSGPDGSVAPTEDDLSSPAAHSDAHDPAGCPARSVAVAPDGSVPRDPADSHSDDFHPDALHRAGSLPASRLDDSRSEDLRPDGFYPACSHSAEPVDSHRAGLVDSAPDDLRSVGLHPADLHLVDCQAVPDAHWPMAGCRDDCPAYPECP
jgi:hypothetical protein